MQYQIISDWAGNSDRYLLVNKGDVVTLGKTAEEYEWKNWQECSIKGNIGWIPIQLIKILQNNTGEVTEDYSAYELKTNIGETFTCIKEINGWFYGFINTRNTIFGWIPKKIVIIKEDMFTEIKTKDISDLINFIKNYKKENNRTITHEILNKIEKEVVEIISAKHSFAFKCKDNNKVFCGYIIFHILNFPMINGKEAYITELFIDKNQRGKGIGTKFLQIAERIARENNCSRLMLNNPKDYESYDRIFYSKKGYTERVNFANFVKDLCE